MLLATRKGRGLLSQSTRSTSAPRLQTVLQARGRRVRDAAAADDAPEPEAAAEDVVRSARTSSVAQRRARRTSGGAVVTPTQVLQELGILAVNDVGKQFIDVSCMGRNQAAWYAVGVLEGKESKFLDLLGNMLEQYGYSFSWTEAASEAERGFQPASVGPEGTLLSASPPGLLEQFDVVPWLPKKTAMVYSHNTDKLAERKVAFSRGTGGAWVLLHMVLDPALVDIVATTYYFMAWRHCQEVSGVLLKTAGLLPPGHSAAEVYTLPVPCPAAFLKELQQWHAEAEAEDLQAKRVEFYGSGGGTTFGEPEQYDRDKKNLDTDESGNVIYREDYAGTYKNPNRWSEDGGRGSRGGGSSARGRGRGRQQQQQQRQGWLDAGVAAAGGAMPWEQQQQQEQAEEDRAAAPAGGRGFNTRMRQMDFMGEMGSDRYGSDDDDVHLEAADGASGAAHAEAGGGRDGGYYRDRQMDFMGEMGSGRYGGRGNNDAWDRPVGKQQQQGQRRGWQQQQQNNQRSLGRDWFGSETASDDAYAWAPAGAPAGADPAAAAGDRGFENRMHQMDFMEEMGSDRYSSGDDDDDQDRAAAKRVQQQREAAGGARDGGRQMQRQLDFMSEMGSGRYEDPAAAAAGGGSSSSSGGKASLMSDFASAFDDLLSEGSSGSWGQQQAGSAAPGAGSSGGAGVGGRPPAASLAGGSLAAAGDGLQSYMDEDTFSWGGPGAAGPPAAAAGTDPAAAAAGSAAARQLHEQWQQEDGPAPDLAGYGPPGDRSMEGFGASFEFDFDDAGLADLAGLNDPALVRDMPRLPGSNTAGAQPQQQDAGGVVKSSSARGTRAVQQQQQQQQGTQAAAAGRKSRGGAAAAARAAAKDADAAAGFVGASSSDLDAAEGLEAGWADRLMASVSGGLDDDVLQPADDGMEVDASDSSSSSSKTGSRRRGSKQ